MTTHPADPSAGPVRWGILATGNISTSFVRDLGLTPGAELRAVGSRSADSAGRFAADHGIERAYGSYAALLADPEVDVVYIGTPHTLHLENARAAFEAGKHVLCEKPLAMNLREAEELVSLAARHDRFCMEAMWMACNPVIRAITQGLRSGRFGQARQVHADLGFVVDRPTGDRLVDPALGAGALLDMGIYPLTLANLVLGPARDLAATASLSADGYDTDLAIAGRHDGGALSSLTSSMTSWSPRTATIATSTGRVDLPADFHCPTSARWTAGRGEPEAIEGVEPLIGRGYGNEALEVQRCLADGVRESSLVPHDQSLSVIEQMDRVRRSVGVRYAVD